MAKIEIACFNVRSAIIAQQNEADRVELCADMNLGGTTPTIADIKEVRNSVIIDLNVMIRPRGGNFEYTDIEFQQMKNEIITIKELGVDGLVFGILNADNTVNISQNTELVELAYPLPCTFHRAFDEVKAMEIALEDVIGCGFKTILTSGCKPNVNDGLLNLKKLVTWASNRIIIMPGGGLRSTNIESVLQETGALCYHSSAITDGTETAVPDEVKALKSKVGLLG